MTTLQRRRRKTSSGRVPPALGFALLVAIVVLGIELWVERTAPYHVLELETYDALQRGLELLRDREDSNTPSAPGQVIIVDIGSLQPSSDRELLAAAPFTPRDALRSLLNILVDAGPAAIGIDIDFSPEGGAYVSPKDDPGFFRTCLHLERERNVAVFLGVGRGAGGSRNEWLGNDEFAPLAASLIIPDDTADITPGGTPGPYAIAIPPLRSDPGDGSEGRHGGELLSLGVAMAKVLDPDIVTRLGEQHCLIEAKTERAIVLERGVEEFTVDYSELAGIERAMIRATFDRPSGQWKLPDGWQSQVKKRLVLVGDVQGSAAADVFKTTGSRRLASGILMHAGAGATLLRGPLYVFRHRGRVAIDATLVTVTVAAVSLVRRRKNQRVGRGHKRLSPHNALLLLPLGFVALTLVMAAWYRILWLDVAFAFFAAVTPFHNEVEHGIDKVLRWLSRRE